MDFLIGRLKEEILIKLICADIDVSEIILKAIFAEESSKYLAQNQLHYPLQWNELK